MFGFNKDTPAPTPNAAPEGQPPAEGSVSIEGQAAPTPEPEGLDRFQQMLDNKPNTDPDGTPKPEADKPFDAVALLNDPEAMAKITGAMDFSSAISDETQQKLADGAPDAIMSLVQDVGREAYATSLKHASILANQTIDDRLSRLEKTTGDQISSSLNKHELNRELPELTNPLVSMAVSNFQEKLQAQNPTMTTSQVATETRNYLTELSKAVNPDGHPAPTPKDGEVDGVTDWFDELGLSSK